VEKCRCRWQRCRTKKGGCGGKDLRRSTFGPDGSPSDGCREARIDKKGRGGKSVCTESYKGPEEQGGLLCLNSRRVLTLSLGERNEYGMNVHWGGGRPGFGIL